MKGKYNIDLRNYNRFYVLLILKQYDNKNGKDIVLNNRFLQSYKDTLRNS